MALLVAPAWYPSPPLAGGAEPKASDSAAAGGATDGPSRETRVAILELEDKGPSAELAILRLALVESLVGDLSALPGIHVVERNNVDQFVQEKGIGASGISDPRTAQLAGRELAADFILSGSFSGRDREITATIALRKRGESTPIVSVTESASADGFLDLEQRLLRKITGALPAGPRDPDSQAAPAHADAPLIAVMEFQNLSASARLDSLAEPIAELLQVSLGETPEIRLVERESLENILKEQELALSGLTDARKRIQIAKLLGAQRMIHGFFLEVGEDVRIEARIADTTSGAIVHNARVSGKSGAIARLIPVLARDLAVASKLRPPESFSESPLANDIARKLETLDYFRQARAAFDANEPVKAASLLRNVLAIDPTNLDAHDLRCHALLNASDFRGTLAAAKLAASQPVPERRSHMRWRFVGHMAYAYHGLNQPEQCVAVSMPALRDATAQREVGPILGVLSTSLQKLGRAREAMEYLEKAVAATQFSGDPDTTERMLRHLYYTCANFYDPTMSSKAPPSPEESRRMALRAVEVYNLMLEQAAKHPSAWRGYEGTIVYQLTGPRWRNERGRAVPVLTLPEQEQFVEKTIQAFSWSPQVVWEARYVLARLKDRQGKGREARADYEYVVEHADDGGLSRIPAMSDYAFGPDGTLAVFYPEARARLLELAEEDQGGTGEKEDRTSEKDLVKGYEAAREDIGYAHQRGGSLLAAAVRFELPPLELPKTALIWGGGTTAARSWREFLEPLGYKVHGVEERHLVAGHLLPYPLVVLDWQGCYVFTPREIEALRGYVATGGSLLVLVSPGWDNAQPLVHRPLLARFDVRVGDKLGLWTKGEAAAAHPITTGIAKADAKDAVALYADPASSIVRQGDKSLLIARAHDKGRLAVASFGQWSFPSTRNIPAKYSVNGYCAANQRPLNTRPLEWGARLEQDLLESTVRWLLEPRSFSPEDAAARKALVAAGEQALKVYYGVAPWASLTTLVKELPGSVPAPWREEALWLVAEARVPFLLRRDDVNPLFPRTLPWSAARAECGPPDPEPYEQLAREFPDSPRRPFALLAAARARRAAASHAYQLRSGRSFEDVLPTGNVAGAYAKVTADKPSYAWAWTRLELGEIHLIAGAYAEAFAEYRQVVEAMEPGPEKALALLNGALSLRAMGKTDEARRYYGALNNIPNLQWRSGGATELFTPIFGFSPRYCTWQTSGMVSILLAEVDRPVPDDPFNLR